MTPSPERAELTAALRDLKRRTGLSLTGLEERTPFSRSSWGRYLKGETLPPREAVRELCRLAGEPEGRCLALWELAESETSGRAAAPPPAEPPPVPAPRRRQGVRRIAAVTAAVLTAALAATLAAALLLPRDADGPEGPEHVSSATSRTPAAADPAPPDPRCRNAACEAKDPMNMLCGTRPRTLAAHRTATGAHLELRHSPSCGASWARIWSTRVGDRIELTAGSHTRSAEVLDALDARNYLYTPMTATNPGTLLRACFRPAAKGTEECIEATVR